MGIAITWRRKALWPGLLLASFLILLLLNGCTGMEPYDPPDYREEPPVHGLLTGEEGEFVIYRKADEPEAENKAINKGDDKTDNE